MTPIRVHREAEKRVDFEYNAAGQYTEIARYSDLAGSSEVATTAYGYDQLGRLTDLTHVHDTTTIADYDWTYDAFSRVTSFTSPDGSSDYTYDETGQLTDADHDFQTDESYEYDENGNRTNTGYTTGDNNQLTSDGTFDYTYDDEGNRLTRTRISQDPADDYETLYEWDHHNRLTKITYKNNSGSVTKEIEYVYDVWGSRIEKQIDWDGAGAGGVETIQYIYDGFRSDRGNAGDHIILAFDGDDALTNRYLHGPDVDQILADEQFDPTTSGEMPTSPGDLFWILADKLGSVRDILSSNGTVQNHITYDSFGNVTSETDDTVDHIFGFQGREKDEESDLMFFRARPYDPLTAKFIAEDPLGIRAGDTNFTRFVGNGPTNGVDPSGLEGIEAIDHLFSGKKNCINHRPRRDDVDWDKLGRSFMSPDRELEMLLQGLNREELRRQEQLNELARRWHELQLIQERLNKMGAIRRPRAC